MRLLLFGGDAVVLGDLAVDAEENRFFLDRKIARRTLPATGSTLIRKT